MGGYHAVMLPPRRGRPAAVLALVASAACGPGPSPASAPTHEAPPRGRATMDDARDPPPPIADPADALDDEGLIAAVAAHWASLPEARRAAHPSRARIDALIADSRRPPAVTARPCADVRQAILARDPSPDPSTIVDGGLDVLADGDCRVVSYPGLLGAGLDAVLTPDGRVLLLRIVEEG
jgi:hypothetical protein